MKTSTSQPTTPLRRMMASALVIGYGWMLGGLWGAPLAFLSYEMQREWPKLLGTAVGSMVVLAFGFQLLPRRLYQLWSFERDGWCYRRLGVRRFRFLASRGEGIERLARLVDPNWQNPVPKLSPDDRMLWTRATEGLHWAFLIGSLPLVALFFYLGFTARGTIVLLLNVPLNAYPIMLQRYTRAKLMRIDALRARRASLLRHAPIG